MKLDRNELSKAVRVALSMGAVAAVGVVGTAQAQDQNAAPAPNQPQTLQTIVVTGSHIRRVDLETSNPVIAVDRQQIQHTGKLTLGDIIQDIPAVMGPQTNPQVNNSGGGGTSSVALRGLGAARTLVLLDGHRINNSDVNTIPVNMVERIEVLTDGASAVYGSDAVAGVVNIITRKNYQGAEFSADYGISDRDDGMRKGYHFMFGQTSDKGSITAGVDYNKQNAIFEGNRADGVIADPATALVSGYKGHWHLSPALSLSSTTNGGMGAYAGGSATGIYGNVALPTTALKTAFGCSNVARNAGTDGTTLADYHCFGPSDKYNYAAINYALTPQERTNAFFDGTYHLTDNVDAYALVYYNKTSSASDLAPIPVTTGGGLVVDAATFYNPFGSRFANSGGGSKFGFRAAVLPPRGSLNGADNGQVSTGLKGTFPIGNQTWNWDLGFDYGHSSSTSVVQGLTNLSVLNNYLGPYVGMVGGTPMCGTGVPCANAFDINDPTLDAALKASLFSPLAHAYSQEKIGRLDVNGGLFDLPAGTIQLAAGLDDRKEYTRVIADPALQVNPATSYTCSAGSQCTSSLQGGYSVKEAYAELFVPILKDLPFVKSLNVTLGDRYSKYSNFGSTSNGKLAVEYRPIDDLLLRGTVSKVFRAPAVGDIFGAPNSNADKLSSDPCNGFTGAAAGSGPALACAGVNPNGTFVNQDVAQNVQTSVISSGSNFAGFPLGPEKGRSFDFGFVYSPHFVPGLTVSADAWRIYLNNTITTLGLQSTLNLCYGGQLVYCPLIHRFTSGGSQGEIAPNTIDPTGNLGRTDTKGVDMSASYKLPQFSFGQFNIGVNATYLAQYNNASAPGLSSNLTTYDAGHFLPFGSPGAGACPGPNGGVCLFPRWRGQAHLDWQLGPWDASIRTRYIGHFKMGSEQLSQDVNPAGRSFPGLVLNYGATVYTDLQLGYNIEPINTRIDFGVDNVADKAPPLLYANNTLNGNSDPSDFDYVGRYYWGRVTVKF